MFLFGELVPGVLRWLIRERWSSFFQTESDLLNLALEVLIDDFDGFRFHRF